MEASTAATKKYNAALEAETKAATAASEAYAKRYPPPGTCGVVLGDPAGSAQYTPPVVDVPAGERIHPRLSDTDVSAAIPHADYDTPLWFFLEHCRSKLKPKWCPVSKHLV